MLVGAGAGLDGIADVAYESEEHTVFQSEETRLLKLLERVAKRV